MIGGVDVVIPAVGEADALQACVRIVQHRWPNARFEDVETGEKYAGCGEIPLEHVRELLAYSDAQAEAAWDADREDSPPNSMLYLIRSPDFITVVLDDPNTVDMKALLEEFRTTLQALASTNGNVENNKHLLK
jgi:hypothetical protein